MTTAAKHLRNTVPHGPAGSSSHFIKTKDIPQIKLRPIKALYNLTLSPPFSAEKITPLSIIKRVLYRSKWQATKLYLCSVTLGTKLLSKSSPNLYI